MQLAPAGAHRLLSDAEAIRTARKAAHLVHREGSPIPLEDLEQTACLEAIRVVRTASDTLAAHRAGLLYKRCREACIRLTVRERGRQAYECELSDAAERQAKAITRKHSWAYVYEEPVRVLMHEDSSRRSRYITSHVWSFKLRGGPPEFVKRAIEKLCSAEKHAAELVYLQGLTQQQAAQRLGIPQSVMNDRLRLVVKKLGHIFKNDR